MCWYVDVNIGKGFKPNNELRPIYEASLLAYYVRVLGADEKGRTTSYQVPQDTSNQIQEEEVQVREHIGRFERPRWQSRLGRVWVSSLSSWSFRSSFLPWSSLKGGAVRRTKTWCLEINDIGRMYILSQWIYWSKSLESTITKYNHK
jgi:hypothetical protein